MKGQGGDSTAGWPAEALLAVDVGTSGARASAFDLEGHRLLEVRHPYPIVAPQPGWAEQDARQWRAGALSALGRTIRALGPAVRVRGISLTGQCPSVVPTDAAGNPLGPGLMYRDNRATAEAEEFRERFGDAEIHRRTGHLPAAFHIGPKVLWLRRHRPGLFARTARFLQPRDLALLALTGEMVTDGTHAAGTLLFDLRGRRWDAALFEALELDPGLFPPVRESTTVVGELRPWLMRRFGLADTVPVVLGGADSQACALGAGVVGPGPVSEMAGSSTCLNAAVPVPLDELLVTHYTHVVPGPYTTETGLNTTGAAIEWLADLLYGGRAGRARGSDYLRLDAEASAIGAGADGVLALPVLGDGERTDPDLRAAFTGLSQRHGRAVMARAMLEGTVFSMRRQLELLRHAGTPVNELRVSGGDTRLATWNRIKADILGVPVVRVPGDAASTGVAMLAGLGAGVYRDPEEAIERCVHLEERIEPDERTHDAYEVAYAAHCTLADAAVARLWMGRSPHGEG
ncbi:MAG: xylulokinase [Candidatus Limnocylindrales bacterium]